MEAVEAQTASRPARRARWEIAPQGGDTAQPHNLATRLQLIESLLPDLVGLRVLDAGCGGGAYVRALADRGADAHGIDFVEDKLEAARRLPEALTARISFGDIQDTGFADESFDAILLNEVLEHVPDDEAALRELRRILRPDGSLLILSPNRLHPFETHGVYLRHSGRRLSHATPFIPWIPVAWGRSFLRYWARNYWPGELRRMLEQSGFTPRRTGFLWPTFENISGRQPRWMKPLTPALRGASRVFEQVPVLRAFGASQWILASPAPLASTGAVRHPRDHALRE